MTAKNAFFQYPRPQHTNHDKINQVRKTKHPYLLTLPWTTIFATTQKHKIVLYKLTLYLPSNSRKKTNEKNSGTYGNQKNKEANKTYAEEKSFTLRLPIEREKKSPSWPKPNLCETWVMKNCDLWPTVRCCAVPFA
jgi:hypothetical protein